VVQDDGKRQGAVRGVPSSLCFKNMFCNSFLFMYLVTMRTQALCDYISNMNLYLLVYLSLQQQIF
jgi:hypothetical protein